MATKKQISKLAAKPALKKPDMSAINAVRNPNFDAALAQQDYMNTLAQLIADRQAMGAAPNLIPIGGTGISAAEMQNLSPERRTAIDQRMAATQGGLGGLTVDQAGIPAEQRKILDNLMAKEAQQPIPLGGGLGGPRPNQNAENIQREFERYASGINDFIPAPPQQGSQKMSTIGGLIPKSTIAGSKPAGQMNPQKMQAFQNFLQQGMQRNQDMNQAAQNFAGMGGPQKSFSQVAGGINRMNRMPRKPNPNAIAPSNQKLI
jgi:hypothetical protein